MTANVLYWVDAEGFGDVQTFLLKELAVFDSNTQKSTLYYFKVGKFSNLNYEQRAKVLFLKRNTHGLKFADSPNDLPQAQARSIILALCRDAEAKNKFIAYKGSAHLSYIFKSLGYEHIGLNIEDLDCLPYKKIIHTHAWLYDKHMPTRCSKHGARGQCARMKINIYMDYLNYSRQNCKPTCRTMTKPETTTTATMPQYHTE